MTPIGSSFYAEWRVRAGVVPLLREDTDSPPERLLQAIWLHQRLLRDRLLSRAGEPVRVLHPGFQSLEGGPDFRDALIQIGDGPARRGDVEVDLRPSGWRAHGHDRNPAFAHVILHVTWDGEEAPSGCPPGMGLRGLLDAPLGELSLWLGNEGGPGFPPALRGRCHGPMQTLAAEKRDELLRQAALVRLASKAGWFQARARQAGWEQALWEGLFRALGYKHNAWPMQRLAELRPRWAGEAETLGVQARLLGLSGLLPPDLTRALPVADGYVRQVWDAWWRERDRFADCVLPREAWRLHGIRPANHPQRRLALASHWVREQKLPARLQAWCATPGSPAAVAEGLLECLRTGADDFWSWHWTLKSRRLASPATLLGPMRAGDLAMNVVIPWLWARAAEGGNAPLRNGLEARYFSWPAGEDNSLLRLARERLLGGGSRRTLATAAAQQGLTQLVRDFCEHSNAVCDECRLPAMIAEWRTTDVSLPAVAAPG